MSSANNLIGMVTANLSKSTAAGNVSKVANNSRTTQKSGTGFDSILNKATENLTQNKTIDRNQIRDVRKSLQEVRTTSPYKADTTQKTEANSDVSENKGYDKPVELDEETLAKVAAYINQNGIDTFNTEIDGTVISQEDILNILGGQIPSASELSEVPEMTDLTSLSGLTGITDLTSLTDIQTDLTDILATDFDTISAELQKAIIGDSIELFNNVAAKLDLPEEDIVNAMQTLGLMAMDLLNPANMQQLVTELSGGEQGIDLITDSDIYTSLQDLMEGAESMNSELMNEFDLSEEGLQSAIADTKEEFGKQLMAQQNMTEDSMENATGDLQEVPSEMTLEEKLKAREEKLARMGEGKSEKVNTEEAPQSEEFAELASTDKKESALTSGKTMSDNQSKNFRNDAESSNLFNQLVNKIADAAMEVKNPEQVSYTDRAQMQDIIRQITDRITISQGAGETSMELALHPASLGNVNILLTSGKDGIVAKFTAQNEIVKEAVETQMAQLQQKFDEQGIKITSIEVTIASHGFEQNLDQEGGRQSRNAEDAKKTKPLRRINLSEIDDGIADQVSSEAEKIAVQMMAANGNSVDFSA